MLIVHHLNKSQSERIVWLCEELGIEYELRVHPRDSKTLKCPPELAALSPTKSAPVIQDGSVTLGETGAITEYILSRHGNGKLAVPVSADNYADYLYYLHFANGYFQPAVGRYNLATSLPPDNVRAVFTRNSFEQALQILNDRLSKSTWLAGDEFTAADILNVFSLTTMRLYAPYSLEGYDGILAFLKRVSEREGYQRAMQKGDPGFEPVMAPEKPKAAW